MTALLHLLTDDPSARRLVAGIAAYLLAGALLTLLRWEAILAEIKPAYAIEAARHPTVPLLSDGALERLVFAIFVVIWPAEISDVLDRRLRKRGRE